jgi:signal transduction histidine kinase
MQLPEYPPKPPDTAELLRQIDRLEREAARLAEHRSSVDERQAELLADAQRRLSLLAGALESSTASETRAETGERQARAAQAEAERLNRGKAELLVTLSHDLRQPLTVLLGSLDILAKHVDEPRRPVLNRAVQAGYRLERAFDELMLGARLEYGGVTPQVRAFDLGALFDELRSQHETAARDRGLRLRVVPCRHRAMSDAGLVGTIIHNFLGNAIKYTRVGGVLVGCRRRGDRLLIEVCDSGIGIPSDMLEAIFAEFRQLDSEGSTGVGLGLSIAKRAADLLGHPLSVRSSIGRGSCFGLEVPRAP